MFQIDSLVKQKTINRNKLIHTQKLKAEKALIKLQTKNKAAQVFRTNR